MLFKCYKVSQERNDVCSARRFNYSGCRREVSVPPERLTTLLRLWASIQPVLPAASLQPGFDCTCHKYNMSEHEQSLRHQHPSFLSWSSLWEVMCMKRSICFEGKWMHKIIQYCIWCNKTSCVCVFVCVWSYIRAVSIYWTVSVGSTDDYSVDARISHTHTLKPRSSQ